MPAPKPMPTHTQKRRLNMWTSRPRPGPGSASGRATCRPRRLVVRPTLYFGGPVGLRHPAAWIVVRIVVALAVAELFGRVVRGVTQMLGHLARGAVTHISLRAPERRGRSVRLGGGGQVHD